MLDARAKFRELTRVFDPIYQPRLAAADGPGASYVPETHADYRRQLEVALDFNDHTKLLVAGQPGCGKTTLLLSLADELRRDGRLVAFVDLEARMTVQDLNPVEMYLAAFAALVGELRARGVGLGGELLAAARDWLAPFHSEGEPSAAVGWLEASLVGLLQQVRCRLSPSKVVGCKRPCYVAISANLRGFGKPRRTNRFLPGRSASNLQD